MRDELFIFAAIILAVAIFAGGFVYSVVMLTNKPNCAITWEPRETEWSWRGGCRVKIDGTWTPASAVWIKADKN